VVAGQQLLAVCLFRSVRSSRRIRSRRTWHGASTAARFQVSSGA